MTLGKKLGLFAASAAVLGLGTLAATKPASASPLIPVPAATAGHYGLDLSLFFGNGGRDDRHFDRGDRDWQRRDWHSRDRDDHGDRGRDYDHRDGGGFNGRGDNGGSYDRGSDNHDGHGDR